MTPQERAVLKAAKGWLKVVGAFESTMCPAEAKLSRATYRLLKSEQPKRVAPKKAKLHCRNCKPRKRAR